MEKPSIEALTKEIDELISTYETVSQTHIPRSIKEAQDEGWQLAAKGIAVEALTAYLPEHRHADSRRAIRMGDAIAIMEGLEETLVQQTVTRPIAGMWKKARTIYAIGQWVIGNAGLIWDVAKAVFDEAWKELILELALHPDDLIAALEKVLGILITMATWFFCNMMTFAVASFSVSYFHKEILKVILARDKVCKALRKKALPQRMATRYVRRKMADL